MYAYIRGILVEATPAHAVVEAHGVGYHIAIPVSVFTKLPQLHEPVVLYTAFVVREMSQALYGFLSAAERDRFETLMGFTGVGPKVALSIIGHLPLERMRQVVMQNDIVSFSKVPGIGKKTAERLILEMKSKMKELCSGEVEEPVSSEVKDAMSALIHLGYNQAVAEKALKRTLEEVSESAGVATLITRALKHI